MLNRRSRLREYLQGGALWVLSSVAVGMVTAAAGHAGEDDDRAAG